LWTSPISASRAPRAWCSRRRAQHLREFGTRALGSVGLPLRASADFDPRFSDYALFEVDSGSASIALRRVAVDSTAVERAAANRGMPAADQWSAHLAQRIIRRNAEALKTAC